ncbi:hypothetical protein ACEWY4_025282 [Coilia grayii]|uniref:Uncharacterized protein n=1 Tax=Coilia grayii TaxID=363190 RepID=A0ABD1IX48_9TELE
MKAPKTVQRRGTLRYAGFTPPTVITTNGGEARIKQHPVCGGGKFHLLLISLIQQVSGMASRDKIEPFPKPLVQFWMGKACEWSEATVPSAQLDACRHLERLRGFLQEVLGALRLAASVADALQALPFVGQLLGRLCCVPCVTADEASSTLLLQCLRSLFSPAPQTTIERKANDWIRKTMCHLLTADEERCCVMKHVGLPSEEYNTDSLTKTVTLLTEAVNRGCGSVRTPSERCLCDGIHSLSLTCIPLVTRPEAAPLIGALLRRPVSCDRAQLSEEFVETVFTSFLSKKLHLDVHCAGALWRHSLSSLERALFHLLRSALSLSRADLRGLDQQVNDSLLPQACAQHCSIFLVVNEIFRSTVLELEESAVLRMLIQSFTRCFLTALAAQDPEVGYQGHREVPQEAWLQHLTHVSTQLQLATTEFEDRDDRPRQGHRHCGPTVLPARPAGLLVRQKASISSITSAPLTDRPKIASLSTDAFTTGGSVFEVWFLLVQGGGWVDVAAQLLASTEPHTSSSSSSYSSSSSSAALLWLLTFFYHPTNRGHQRTQQWERMQRVWGDLRGLCLRPVTPPPPHPPPVELEAVAESLHSSSSSTSKLLLLRLLLNLAIFCPSQCDTTILQLIRKMSEKKKKKEEEEGVEEEEVVSMRREAECLLAAVAAEPNSGTLASARVQARLRTLEDTLWNAFSQWREVPLRSPRLPNPPFTHHSTPPHPTPPLEMVPSVSKTTARAVAVW